MRKLIDSKPYQSPRIVLTLEQDEKRLEARLRTRGLENCSRDRWKVGRVPSCYEDGAIKAEARGHFMFAARLWYLAACVSIGHCRAERYEAAAARAFANHQPK